MLIDIKVKDIDLLKNLLSRDMDKVIRLKKKYKNDKARISILNDDYRDMAILDSNLDKIKQILGGADETY